MGEHLLTLFAVTAGAVVLPVVGKALRVPSAALEIIYGMFVFNNLIKERPEWFFLMKELGLIYLMFIAGVELRMREIIRTKRFLWYLLIPLLPFVMMPFVFRELGGSFYLGIAVAMISAGIVIPVLKETGMNTTRIGTDIIGIALAGELLSILFLTGLDIYQNFGITLMAALQAGKLLFFMLLSALFLRSLYLVAWWNPEKVKMVMESEDPVEEGIRGIMFIIFTGAGLTYLSGVEPILGSFISGVIFSHVFKSKGRFEDKINAVGFGFFTPFFFMGVGAGFDVGLLGESGSILFALFLVSMLFFSNIFPLVFAFFMKLSILEALSMSLLLSSPLSLLVVAGTIGTRSGFINSGMKDSLILAALVSSILFPFLFRSISRMILIQGESLTKKAG